MRNTIHACFVYSLMAHGLGALMLLSVPHAAKVDFDSGAQNFNINLMSPSSAEIRCDTSNEEPQISKATDDVEEAKESGLHVPKPQIENVVLKAKTANRPASLKPKQAKVLDQLASLSHQQSRATHTQGVADEETLATIIRAPKPPFPMRARRIGFQGRAMFKVDISSTGEVTGVTLIESSGRKDCDNSAKDTILEKWKFSPATLLGKKIKSSQKIAIRFALE